LNWYLEDEQLIIDNDKFINENEAIVLNSRTGLINKPVKKDDKIEVTALLQAGIKPGKTVKIESSIISGFFKVLEVVYTGDTSSEQWQIKAILQ
jgi:hypothetical protein